MDLLEEIEMKFSRKITAVTFISLIALSLSGCKSAGLYALPDQERYQYIHAIRDELKISEAGEVISEEYDNADGVFGQSFLRIRVKGVEAFRTLSQNASNIEDAVCDLRPTDVSSCSVGREIKISIKEDSSNSSLITIYDFFNGKREVVH